MIARVKGLAHNRQYYTVCIRLRERVALFSA
jgi:hypothetical protein